MIRIFVISGTFISDTSNREFPRRFLKEWTKGIVCDVENGAKAKAMIVSTLLD